MPIDTEKYRKHLKTLHLKKEQEDIIIHFICRMMEEIVLAAFGKHPVQQAQKDKQNTTLEKNRSMLISSFENTAHNTKK